MISNVNKHAHSATTMTMTCERTIYASFGMKTMKDEARTQPASALTIVSTGEEARPLKLDDEKGTCSCETLDTL